ncbi:MAG: TetR/AcrR family transcriptional regulator [Defluviitaleaceae bacterium]|nr:TetR/AcrR family transcriptional regulator [Defluviitaleaceae bacterium]
MEVLNKLDSINTKQRILDVAAEMFSQKGFAATRVDKIALEAGINKALIYYYFPSKEAILDHLIESFFEEVSATSMAVIRNTVLKFKQEGRMDILPDRFEFATKNDLIEFLSDSKKYYEITLDNLIVKRQILRIITLESLSDGKHKRELFRYYAMMENVPDNQLFSAVYDVDNDFSYNAAMIFNKFFFSVIPLINFVIYSDTYAQMSGQSMEELKKLYLDSLFARFAGHIEENSIIFQSSPIL